MKTSLLATFALLTMTALTACSSDDDGGSGGSFGEMSIPATFSAYCTGTLLVEQTMMRPAGSGSWLGRGQKVPAGTKVLLEANWDHWEHGYTFDSTGVIRAEGDFVKGLVVDVDVSTDCPTPDPLDGKAHPLVILEQSTIYATKDLTGTPCTLEVGSTFSGYSYAFTGTAAQFKSSDLTAICGFDTGYSTNLTYAKLVAK